MQTKKNKLMIALYLCFFILLVIFIFIIMNDKKEEFTYSNMDIPNIMKIGDTYKISYDFKSSKIFNKSNPNVKFWIEEGNDIITLSEDGVLSAEASGLVVLGIKAPTSYNPETAHKYFVVSFVPIFINQNTELNKIFNNQLNNSDFQHIIFNKYVENIRKSYIDKYDDSIMESTAIEYGTRYHNYEPLRARIEIFDEKFGPDHSDGINEHISFDFNIDTLTKEYADLDIYLTIFKDNTVVYNYKDTDIHVNVSNIKDFKIRNGKAEVYIESLSHTKDTWAQGASDDEIVWLKGIRYCYSTYYFELNQEGVVQYAKNTENDFCD